MNYFDLSDAGLVLRLKQDDRIALETIFRRYAHDLSRYVSQKINTVDDYEEIVIDVFIALWLDRHSVYDDLNEYLSNSVKNKLVSYVKDAPHSQLNIYLKQSFYEKHEEEKNSEGKK